MPEETQGYKLSQPKQSLAEYQKMGKYWSRPATLQTFDTAQTRATSPSNGTRSPWA